MSYHNVIEDAYIFIPNCNQKHVHVYLYHVADVIVSVFIFEI